MANPTTYFGWVLPTPTDLVTDLPADFDVALQGVDTSLQDLLGGTTGQVLSKTSGTNMDFTWVTPTDQTPLTTKGDLFTFSTVDARLGVGSNDQILVADSSTATGLKWAAASSGAFTLIQRTAFSGVATTTTSFDNVFTSTYKVYRVVIEDIASSAAPPVVLYWQWRYAGPTTQTSSYYGVTTKITFNAGVLTTTTMNNASQYSIMNIGNSAANAISFDVYQVGTGSSVYPLIYGMGAGYSGDIGSWTMGGSTDTARNYTGFILSGASANITGTVAIYGLATS